MILLLYEVHRLDEAQEIMQMMILGGHNMPQFPFADPYLLDFAADADPYLFLYPEQELHQPRPRRSYWADQYREMEETPNFSRQGLPLAGIKRIMKADGDMQMVSTKTLVIFARACEMFIIELTHKGWAHAQERNRVTIENDDIVDAVNKIDYCDFLVDIRTTEEAMDQAAPTAISGAALGGGLTELRALGGGPAKLRAPGGGSAELRALGGGGGPVERRASGGDPTKLWALSGGLEELRRQSRRTSGLRWWSGKTSSIRWWSGGTPTSGGGPAELRDLGSGLPKLQASGGGPVEFRRQVVVRRNSERSLRRSKEARAIYDLSLVSLGLVDVRQNVGRQVYVRQNVRPLVVVRQNVGPQVVVRQNVEPLVVVRQNVEPLVVFRQNVGPLVVVRQNVGPQMVVRRNVGPSGYGPAECRASGDGPAERRAFRWWSGRTLGLWWWSGRTSGLQHLYYKQQQLRTLWANQYREIVQTKIFKNHNLPLARIKKIMKADEDVQMIAVEVPVVFARACEMFILELTHRGWTHAEKNKRRSLQKNDIATAIRRTDIFDFLVDILPGRNLMIVGDHDIDGNELPRLVYVSREKRPGFQHHKKAGAMNALIHVSAVLTNAPFMLNLDCDHYINNSKAIRESMCFLMDPQVGRKINMKGLDGIQGPVYVGTGCVFHRQALYGYSPPKGPKRPKMVSCDCCPCFGRRKKPRFYKNDSELPVDGGVDEDKQMLMSQMNFDKRFGQSTAFVTSTLMEQGGVPPSSSPAALLKEAIHVISCGYEDKTEWGTEDILTGFKMHCCGWRSVYCMPERPAFKGSAPINLSDRLNQVLRWALGSVEIFFSRHSPVWYGYKNGHLKWLERFSYINTTIYPFTSLPLLAYCTLPAVCLLTRKFIMPSISTFASLFFIALFISIFATGILELRWSGVSIEEWWRNEQLWVIGGVSAHLFVVVQGLLKILAGIDTKFTVTSKASDDEEFGELYTFKWTTLLIPPTTILIINIVGVVAGISDAINNGYQSWGPLFGKLFFSFWVIVHLYPFLKGLIGRQNRTPTIVVIWSILLASIFSLLWVRIYPFVPSMLPLSPPPPSPATILLSPPHLSPDSPMPISTNPSLSISPPLPKLRIAISTPILRTHLQFPQLRPSHHPSTPLTSEIKLLDVRGGVGPPEILTYN
ncbi:hypothetical protein M5K25_027511 [Dendrobium thyrsiflorum]|uniref:Transcription factor CBF/NF-Y/archaeal histone domain-containing protein n=1 Tax=Dendrobium thyrsiflorum TaxID=117978 RepID=A0ABD0TU17_DENTH